MLTSVGDRVRVAGLQGLDGREVRAAAAGRTAAHGRTSATIIPTMMASDGDDQPVAQLAQVLEQRHRAVRRRGRRLEPLQAEADRPALDGQGHGRGSVDRSRSVQRSLRRLRIRRVRIRQVAGRRLLDCGGGCSAGAPAGGRRPG